MRPIHTVSGMLQSPTACVLLIAALLGAVVSDVRRHRIPNRLSGLTILAGLACQFAAAGLPGLGAALAGATAGFICFLPFYALRAMGAGDVKFLAAAGTFLGLRGTVAAVVFTLVAGALGAAGYVLWRGASAAIEAWRRDGAGAAAAAAWIHGAAARRERLPFALPIAAGVLTTLIAGSPVWTAAGSLWRG